MKPRVAEILGRQKEMGLTVVGTPSAAVGWEKNNDAVAGEETLTEAPGAEQHMDYGRNSLSRLSRPRSGMPWMIVVCRCVAVAATEYGAYCTALAPASRSEPECAHMVRMSVFLPFARVAEQPEAVGHVQTSEEVD